MEDCHERLPYATRPKQHNQSKRNAIVFRYVQEANARWANAQLVFLVCVGGRPKKELHRSKKNRNVFDSFWLFTHTAVN